MKKSISFVFAVLFSAIIFSQAPEWSKDLTIYEVNIRQYTPEGTFDEFTEQLPRLQEMGAGILWLMPVQPIGKLNRKGSLGSYYSISDYTATNPEFGKMKDFKKLVDEAHKKDMYVILDWVANHTSWDHVWMKEHFDYYTTDKDGKVIPPVADWSDVADLNYDNRQMRMAMINAMKFWITETNIDGFRCDVGMMVPDDFWKEAFTELRKVKPDIFLLAEAEGKQFHDDGFNMTYGWERHHAMNQIAKGNRKPAYLDSLIKSDLKTYPSGSYFMNFTSNHDENSWNGTEFERMGDAAKTFAVLSATIPGMLLIYSGQEVGMNKRLRFFDKDTINWLDDRNFTPLYKRLIEIKKENPALWNGEYGGNYARVDCNNENVYAYIREKNNNKVLVIMNLSNQPQTIKFNSQMGKYTSAFGGTQKIKENKKMELGPWQYFVLIQ
ncbi:MAG: alpha-amylase family glycosyl hydrolase [Chitinophagales bacterium]